MRTAVFFQFQLNSSFISVRTHGIMFGRTLFEYCVRKDTLNYVRKDTLQNMISKTLLANSQQPLGVTFAFFWHFINEI